MNPVNERMTVGIVGLGYVGLPLAVAFAEAGVQVVGVDNDTHKINSLVMGNSYIEDITDERLKALTGKLNPSKRYAPLAKADAIIICVPTPLTPNREPNLVPLTSAAQSVGQVLQRGQLVVLESTTYPGTTRDLLVPILEDQSGLEVGRDFDVAFSPERVDPGNKHFTMENTAKVVGGLNAEATTKAVGLYSVICKRLVPVSTPEVAEMTKLLENIFRSVNIALVNELAILADRMGLDIWEVIDAASTKPYGFMRFEPGPGMGGHCLPVDPFYLTWRAREFHMSTEFIELAGKVNQRMPDYCVERIQQALNDEGLAIRGSKIGILGVSYKAGIGDTRESPALRIMQSLVTQGAKVEFHDPYVELSAPLNEVTEDADALVLITAHPGINYAVLAAKAKLFIDLRGVTRGLKCNSKSVVVQL